ncbi:ScbA/BarX family gamma-butyrolactone biosynthesis protein [Streptomyces antarcticus]|uniref:ScbA/BarX family gamma-butyrolactone biosynthesis protein n=1 Tax=Streptomyces antarcticus TaxID=2996458 RepID=UPI00226E3862|nr:MULTISPECIES: ScbA/BarX family gamma-butyrolactone biosynthesis protein [unclassified Streptomyces]MCY0942893.1 ScbA/BarX family gamma-butyrolactone biosynthesis protein [Streptomyces sp. H34-AA3]MCZ4087339.1 ScbA/BarX family gamma-butyrolactone biosynthesis protein [Streptomyces sp. H34-S5]
MLTTQERRLIAQPDLTSTVAREYVHRAAVSEVFLTGWAKTGTDTFTVSAQWPRSHSFYTPSHDMHDPMLLCETIRQCGMLLSHTEYGLPFGHNIGWSRVQYALNPQAMRIAAKPADITLHVTCSDIRSRRSLPTSMTMHIEAVRDDSLLAVASIGFNNYSPAVYERLRAGRSDAARLSESAPTPPDPVSRSVAGRRRSDIVLSPTQERWRWQLRVDTAHPVLFDHPLDHVPGMLLLESVRQAGLALEPSLGTMMPTSMDMSFNHYVEFDAPCWVEAEAVSSHESGARRSVRVNGIQGGRFAFTATAEMTDMSSV